MARITFSVTPVRFSSIILSVERSKWAGREAMIEIIVFSLKPAFTSLTTAALVSGPLPAEVWAAAWKEQINANKKAKGSVRLNRKNFMVFSPIAFDGLPLSVVLR